MNTRISEFENGISAIRELKNSLSSIVSKIESEKYYPPIIIIIDELDRCRPTYSVKCLEEIKHLFDVNGLVFILGLNSRQLSNSLSHAYGSKFDGVSYLRRFIDRQYTLNVSELNPVISTLIDSTGLSKQHFLLAGIIENSNENASPEISQVISKYMRMFGLTVRDAYSIVDILQTCSAVVKGFPLLGEIIIPFAICHHLKISVDDASKFDQYREPRWAIRGFDRKTRSTIPIKPLDYMASIYGRSNLPYDELYFQADDGDALAVRLRQLMSLEGFKRDSMANPRRYGDLINMVSRFGKG